MRRRIAEIFLALLAAFSLIGLGILNYFGTTRMGMIRWLNYQNRNLESVINVDILKVALAAIAVLLALYIVVLMFKNKANMAASDLVAILINFICLITFLYISFALSTTLMKIYYFAILLAFIATVALSARNLISLHDSKN